MADETFEAWVRAKLESISVTLATQGQWMKDINRRINENKKYTDSVNRRLWAFATGAGITMIITIIISLV